MLLTLWALNKVVLPVPKAACWCVDDMTFAMKHDFLMEEAYGTFEDFLVRNDFIYEIAHA